MNISVAKKPVLKKVSRKSIDARNDAGIVVDDDVPFEANVLTKSNDGTDADQNFRSAIDDAVSTEFVGRWNLLVSQTNWDKGRIIIQWRDAAIEDGADAIDYSDDAWARKVEGVSSGHVGRLRRVYTRFGKDSNSYPGLFWSHFLSAMDWDDAPLWLEGAARSKWSVAQMRHQRWQANGARPDSEPKSNDIVAVDYDDGFQELTSVDDEKAIDSERDDRITSGPLPEGPDFGDETGRDRGNVATADEDASDHELAAQVNPFLSLPEMPEDVAEAMEAMKLAIVRHRCRDWDEFHQASMLQVIDALKKFASHG